MLTLIKDENGEIIVKRFGNLTVEQIDTKKEFKEFNAKEFEENIRKNQEQVKKETKEKFFELRQEVIDNGYFIENDIFEEYTTNFSYGKNDGWVMSIQKDGISVNVHVCGEQEVNIFNEKRIAYLLTEAQNNKNLSMESANKIYDAILYVMNLTQRKIYDNVDPISELLYGKLVEFTKEEIDFLSDLNEGEYYENYQDQNMFPDKLPLGWEFDYCIWENNNWIELFYEKDGVEIPDSDVYVSNDLLDVLRNIDTIYQDGKKYLEQV